MEVLLTIFAVVLGTAIVGTLGVFAVIYFVKLVGLLAKLIAHVARCIWGIIADAFRAVGAVVVAIIFVPLVVLNILIGRWSAASHFGRAFSSEVSTLAQCLYRVVIAHPVRLIGMGAMLEGVERRLPQAFADAPGSDKPSKSTGMFEGYEIIGSLPGGGSGGRLYVAAPNEMKQAGMAKRGHGAVSRVVIKSFSLSDGSSLPQIVRESRALDAARKLGLVLEHEMSPERFFYVMKYVPGENLAAVTQRLHAASTPSTPPGLDKANLREGLGYVCDLLGTLNIYHSHGLWHKDVKPENIIVDQTGEAGRLGEAHLVDFGLITPMRSAMTLTTHGTEYYRDPEMVRQALKGVKVHQINGAKFDVFAAGAVLYQVVEGAFPAHGGLSQVSRRCPESVKWIIRRAMTDYDKRYASADDMLADLRTVAAAEDPYAVTPASLPSVSGEAPPPMPEPVAPAEPFAASTPAIPMAAQADVPEVSPVAANVAANAAAPDAVNPRDLRVSGWWTGKYRVAAPGEPHAEQPAPHDPQPAAQPAPRVRHAASPAPRDPSMTAKDMRKNAKKRVAQRRAHARTVMARNGSKRRRNSDPGVLNFGLVFASFLVLGVVGGGIAAYVVNNEGGFEAVFEGNDVFRFEGDVADFFSNDSASDTNSDFFKPLDGRRVLIAGPTDLPGEITGMLEPSSRVLESLGANTLFEHDARANDDEEVSWLLQNLRGAAANLKDDDDIAGEFQHILSKLEIADGVIWVTPDFEDPEWSNVLLVTPEYYDHTDVEDLSGDLASIVEDALHAAGTYSEAAIDKSADRIATAMAKANGQIASAIATATAMNATNKANAGPCGDAEDNDRTIYVLSDLRQPLEPKLDAALRVTFEGLTAMGFTVRGELLSPPASESELLEETDALAEFRALRKARSLEDRGVWDKLYRVFDDRNSDDGLIWIAPDGDGSRSRFDAIVAGRRGTAFVEGERDESAIGSLVDATARTLCNN